MAITVVINNSVLTDYLFVHCFKNCDDRTRNPYFCEQVTILQLDLYLFTYLYLLVFPLVISPDKKVCTSRLFTVASVPSTDWQYP